MRLSLVLFSVWNERANNARFRTLCEHERLADFFVGRLTISLVPVVVVHVHSCVGQNVTPFRWHRCNVSFRSAAADDDGGYYYCCLCCYYCDYCGVVASMFRWKISASHHIHFGSNSVDCRFQLNYIWNPSRTADLSVYFSKRKTCIFPCVKISNQKDQFTMVVIVNL